MTGRGPGPGPGCRIRAGRPAAVPAARVLLAGALLLGAATTLSAATTPPVRPSPPALPGDTAAQWGAVPEYGVGAALAAAFALLLLGALTPRGRAALHPPAHPAARRALAGYLWTTGPALLAATAALPPTGKTVAADSAVPGSVGLPLALSGAFLPVAAAAAVLLLAAPPHRRAGPRSCGWWAGAGALAAHLAASTDRGLPLALAATAAMAPALWLWRRTGDVTGLLGGALLHAAIAHLADRVASAPLSGVVALLALGLAGWTAWPPPAPPRPRRTPDPSQATTPPP
ncbi:hypothetical protein [Actinosynnema sp. NPDC000082]|uniref:hypothetical protein n=1 Tax=Actinosynnema sp. NPDC000082 TaxID=3363910 RepID=UPI0036C33F54|nr:hypothetical protein [Actinosynnema pretiosum]